MRNRFSGIAFAFALFSSCLLMASAQTKQTSKTSTVADSGQAHDLSGVWMQDLGRPATVRERYWIYELTQDEPPMTDWGKTQYKNAKSSFGAHPYPLAETNDPIYHTCSPPGLPRIYLHPFPMQIVQVPGEVIMLFEYDSIRHQIFTDGRAHDNALGPLWMGDSIGHWEGNTLVADTVNFNEKTWLDDGGHPHSDALHIIERFRRPDFGHIELQLTIDDPKAYTKPWSVKLPWEFVPDTELLDWVCENEKDSGHLVGK